MKKLLFFCLSLPIFAQAMEITQSPGNADENVIANLVQAFNQQSGLLSLPLDMHHEIALLVAQVHSGSVKDFDSLIELACTCKQMAAVVRDKKVQKVWEEQKPFLRANLLPIIRQQKKERLEKLAQIEEKLRSEKIYVPLQEQGINATNAAGQTALECLIRNPNYIVDKVGLFIELLKCGADVNIRDKNGRSLLYWIMTNYHYLFFWVTRSGTYISKESCEQALQALMSRFSGYTGFEYLIENGNYDPNLSADGTTLLHFDIEHLNGKNVELLVCKGVNVNITNKNGETPLFLAAKSRSEKSFQLAQYLLAQGANPHVLDKKSESLLMLAETQKMRELLMSVGLTITTEQATILVEKALTKYCSDELMTFALAHGGQITKDLWKQVIDNRGIKKDKFDWLLAYESNFDFPLSVLKDELAWADLHRPYANARAAKYEEAIGIIQEKIQQATSARIAQIRNPIKRLWFQFKHRKSNDNEK